MAKLQEVEYPPFKKVYAHWCEGCQRRHFIPVEGATAWQFNGDQEKPTFSPSVRHHYQHPDKGDVTECHYFIKAGKIEYCGDCQHQYSGQTRELLDCPQPPKEQQ